MMFDSDFQNKTEDKNLSSKLSNLEIKSIADLNTILSGINSLIHSQTSGIFYNHDGKLIYIAAYGKNDHLLIYQSLLNDESVEGHIFQNSSDVIISKSIDQAYFRPDSSSSNTVMPITIIGTPLVINNKTLGGIIAFNREKNTLFTDADLAVLKKVVLTVSDFLVGAKLNPIDRKLFTVNKYLISNLPFPFLMTNTVGKVEEVSNRAKEILANEDILGKSIFNYMTLYNNMQEEIDLKVIFEEIITKGSEIVLKNVKINKNYDNLYNCQIKYLNPERMVHNVLFYFINTEDINLEKQKLVTNIAHELRTPMTAIMGSVQILLSDFGSGDVTPTQKEFLNILKNEAERFATILSTIIDYKESSDLLGLKEENIKINDLVFELGNTFTMKILKKDIFFKVSNFDAEINIRGDINAVKHIFYQIVDNAIKFSPKGGAVLIKYEGTQLEENKWRHIISIEDEGPGIDADILPKMFESFRREDEAVHSKIGTGLGLSIVKEILDTMGGRIEIKNKEIKGTIVTLFF